MINSKIQSVIYEITNWAKSKSFIRNLWLFGSRVTGNPRPGSDIDIAIAFETFQRNRTADSTWILESRNWTSELQSRIPWKVDLQWYDEANNTAEIMTKDLIEKSLLIYSRE